MGTDKRERQKANRQLKLEEMARDARKKKTKKRGLQIGIGVPVLIVLVFVLVRVFGSTDDVQTIEGATTTSVSTVDTSLTSTTVAGSTAEPLACPATDGSAATVTSFPAAPSMCIDATKKYTVVVDTNMGSYTAELDAAAAPLTVNNFVYLARYHYFDNTPCHRIITDFVIQCGDPTGTGSGGPGYKFADELPAAGSYKVGSMVMANEASADTNGSQFFVVTGDKGVALAPNYSLFGQVTQGLDVVAKINGVGAASDPGTPSTPVTITKVTVTES